MVGVAVGVKVGVSVGVGVGVRVDVWVRVIVSVKVELMLEEMDGEIEGVNDGVRLMIEGELGVKVGVFDWGVHVLTGVGLTRVLAVKNKRQRQHNKKINKIKERINSVGRSGFFEKNRSNCFCIPKPPGNLSFKLRCDNLTWLSEAQPRI